uniref:Uncharacterized protein n=1 Tax=Rhizophora mucronata TaxID=61149 RepID=A0A2P2NQH5_RHIMU
MLDFGAFFIVILNFFLLAPQDSSVFILCS